MQTKIRILIYSLKIVTLFQIRILYNQFLIDRDSFRGIVGYFYDVALGQIYRIRGLFGGGFNLAVWQIFIGSPNLNHAVLPRTHEMN